MVDLDRVVAAKISPGGTAPGPGRRTTRDAGAVLARLERTLRPEGRSRVATRRAATMVACLSSAGRRSPPSARADELSPGVLRAASTSVART